MGEQAYIDLVRKVINDGEKEKPVIQPHTLYLEKAWNMI